MRETLTTLKLIVSLLTSNIKEIILDVNGHIYLLRVNIVNSEYKCKLNYLETEG